MRVFLGVVLVGFAMFGCSGKPPKPADGTEPTKPAAAKNEPVEPASLDGTYIGKLTGEETPENSPLPKSIREVVGDAVLNLVAEGQTFTLMHKGLGLEGSYELDDNQLVLQVQMVEGVSQDDLGGIDLAANKKAGKEPSSPEMLKLFQEILLLTDWRFEVTKDGFNQVGEGGSQPRYEFKRKLD